VETSDQPILPLFDNNFEQIEESVVAETFYVND
jgi:hypothetical protein